MKNSYRPDEDIRMAVKSVTLPHIDVKDKVMSSDIIASYPMKPRVNRKHNGFLGITAAIVMSLVVGGISLGFVSPTMAEYLSRVPILGSAFGTAGDYGLERHEHVNNNASVNLEAVDHDIEIVLDQVVYDGIRLAVGLIHPSDVEIEQLFSRGSITVNGADWTDHIQMTSIHKATREAMNGYTATVFHAAPVKKVSLPHEFEIGINLKHVTKSNADGSKARIEGKWNFETVVKGVENIAVLEPAIAKQKDDLHIGISKVTLTPISIRIQMESNKSGLGHYSNMLLRVFDDRGIELQDMNGATLGIETEGKYMITKDYIPPERTPNSIVIKVVQRVPEHEGKLAVATLPSKFPAIYSQGEAGSLIIHHIEYGSDQTIIDYEVQGSQPYEQYDSWIIWTNDESRTRLQPIGNPRRIGDDSYRFTRSYPAIQSPDEYQMVLWPIMNDIEIADLNFVIPLPEFK